MKFNLQIAMNLINKSKLILILQDSHHYQVSKPTHHLDFLNWNTQDTSTG